MRQHSESGRGYLDRSVEPKEHAMNIDRTVLLLVLLLIATLLGAVIMISRPRAARPAVPRAGPRGRPSAESQTS